MNKIIVDIWSGPLSMDHVARFIRNFDDAIEIAREALDAGELVNLRQGAAWGEYADFDARPRVCQNQ